MSRLEELERRPVPRSPLWQAVRGHALAEVPDRRRAVLVLLLGVGCLVLTVMLLWPEIGARVAQGLGFDSRWERIFATGAMLLVGVLGTILGLARLLPGAPLVPADRFTVLGDHAAVQAPDEATLDEIRAAQGEVDRILQQCRELPDDQEERRRLARSLQEAQERLHQLVKPIAR